MTQQPAPTSAQIDHDRIWQVIGAHRRALADLLDGLSEEQWRHPSLCDGWTVRDVAAHLTLQELGLREVIGTMLRWRGTMDRTIQHAARRRAAQWSTGRICAQLRAMADSRRHTLGVTELETLTDVLVHSQDIALPLGLRLDLPADAATASIRRTLAMRWPPPLPAARVARGFRLVATDVAWSAGTGPQIQGPIAALLLISCGRTAALPQLSGDGVPRLAAALA
ncbi:maleylpyruvate isomerase family mycothiol-dependent enzyme [Dactylosporangium aurantiacum]|uniref:Maleylpyruvate isomerase family mycothiol-dependent enzyme n=1 Tax=Dactylosporangium aurantiacum TaxID=35754 RepID=A0A9Q9ILF6_9ACTN|nr:maleylpyruvate isomerase family mycothiol-dependent enzyme [Dactylosporangium aurantiacum]MDG6106179.1 maleylpyruvate isomerase family mycothiol-dependent enzyme [Dactylosporangium aurantiacum]UWZ58319.1 maleylpyruvate isomerase family mycothiol-dependent enzyme [Dactylosporangium aurantiacum]